MHTAPAKERCEIAEEWVQVAFAAEAVEETVGQVLAASVDDAAGQSEARGQLW